MSKNRIVMFPSTDFYDMTKEEAKQKIDKWKYGF